MVSPSEDPASAAKKPPPPSDPVVAAAASAVASGSKTTTEPTLQQKQLAEFNAWLFRWNNYQQHLATYWQGRYNALYAHTMSGGGKVKKTKSGRVKGNKTEMQWNMRYQEREFIIMMR